MFDIEERPAALRGRAGVSPARRRNPWVAIESGTDPVRRARELARAHADYVGSGDAPAVRGLIAESWRRSMGAGVRPEGHVPPRVHGPAEVRELREQHPLAQMMPALRHLLLDVAEAARHLVAVCSAEGELLWVEGPARIRAAAEETMNFAEGTLWSEGGAGTNALGTALASDKQYQAATLAIERAAALAPQVQLAHRRPAERRAGCQQDGARARARGSPAIAP